MSIVLSVLSLVYQAADFIFKAVVEYSATEQGQKELGEVIAAATTIGLVHPQYVSEALAADEPSDQEAEISRQAADFEKGQEQQNTASAPAPQIHRMPVKNVGNNV